MRTSPLRLSTTNTTNTRSFTIRGATQRISLSRRALLDAVKSLPTTIYRAKGIVLLDDTTQQKGIIHFAGQRKRLIMGEAWGDEKPQTQLVFIGERHGINTDDLQARFDACRTE